MCYQTSVSLYVQDGNFIFTGPYEVERFEANSGIDLRTNQNYPDSKSLKRPRIEVRKYGNGTALAGGVENGEINVAFHLPINALSDLRKADGVRVKSFEVGYHYMTFYNVDSLPDVRVRKAIDHC